jgi:carbon starvation protein
VALVALLALAVLSLGYAGYGRLVAGKLGLDDARPTPAVARKDGVDFVPTRRFYLLGQHFSAIAAAGPIAGPILACQMFGWLPCILWIVLGAILVGSVHDFTALVASVRHGGSSVAEVARQLAGPRARIAFLLFIWVALIYVIVAFTDITAKTFVGLTDELQGVPFNAGGAVAFASVAYLALALIMGLVQRRFAPPLWLMTAIFVPATLGVVAAGTHASTLLLLGPRAWDLLILAYCGVAALLPAWLLLQPRGYLGGFVLYMALAAGLIGLFFSGLEIQQPAFRGFQAMDAQGHPSPLGTLFPFLFVTIACGACSGFHGLVCSGTTSKQVARESDCRAVGYGAMLLESFVAVIALATIMVVADGEIAGRSPGRIYGDGLGRFVATILGSSHLRFAQVFGAMAFSTFVFDTIDVATRLGRLIVQELFGWTGRVAALVGTLATLAPPFVVLVVMVGAPGKPPPYMKFWALFGTANQLLAGLTLLVVASWLKSQGRKAWFVGVPMLLVLVTTTWSLIAQLIASGDLVIRATCVALLLLATLLVVETARAVARSRAVPA